MSERLVPEGGRMKISWRLVTSMYLGDQYWVRLFSIFLNDHLADNKGELLLLWPLGYPTTKPLSGQ